MKKVIYVFVIVALLGVLKAIFPTDVANAANVDSTTMVVQNDAQISGANEKGSMSVMTGMETFFFQVRFHQEIIKR